MPRLAAEISSDSRRFGARPVSRTEVDAATYIADRRRRDATGTRAGKLQIKASRSCCTCGNPTDARAFRATTIEGELPFMADVPRPSPILRAAGVHEDGTPGSARDRHDPHAFDGCGTGAGQFRAISGTPMALAPVGQTLWTQVPALPIHRPRPTGPTATASSCRSAMPSMLLYSLIHLAGDRGDRPPRATRPASPRSASTTSSSSANFRFEDPGPSRISSHDGRRDYHRSARRRLRQFGRHGDRRALAGGEVTTSPNFTLFDHDVYALSPAMAT